jgi:hypothetical protein
VIRHEKEHIETAKKDRAILYSLEINRKYTIPSDRGGSSSTRGVCSVEKLPVLMFAQRVLGYEMPVDEAMELMRQELKVAVLPGPQA